MQRRNNKKKLDILMVKIKLVSRNLMPLISWKCSNAIVPFPISEFIQRSFLSSLSFSLLPNVKRLKGWKKELAAVQCSALREKGPIP